jgi:protein-S-isoprenylcysteine O-methyltransferase Ste14
VAERGHASESEATSEAEEEEAEEEDTEVEGMAVQGDLMLWVLLLLLGVRVACMWVRVPAVARYCSERGLVLGSSREVWLKRFSLVTWWGFCLWPVLRFADYSLSPWFGWLGFLFMLWGFWEFRRAHLDLGRQFSPTLELKVGHRLVFDGAYKRIRHPMYVSIGLIGLGQMLLVPNLIIGPLVLVGWLALLRWRIPYEEAMMRRAFGDSWLWYRTRTDRMIPGVW